MFRLTRPSASELQTFLAAQSQLPLTFAFDREATSRTRAGFNCDSIRIELGTGDEVFRAATQALRQWRQFQLGWVETWPANLPVVEGNCVAVVARVWGLWTLNACRIVQVTEDLAAPARYGFTYATLPEHAECGAELFLISQEHPQGPVCFQIQAISMPRHVLSWIFYPYARHLQNRFRHDACRALQAAVAAALH